MNLNNTQQEGYEVQMEGFSGPLHLLLELIEKEELPITEVSLSQVTEQFLKFVDSNTVPSDQLADFLTVATRLLYLKSRELIPEMQEDEEVQEDLASQLRLYKMFHDAAEHIETLYDVRAKMWIRTKSIIPRQGEVEIPKNLDTELVHSSFVTLIKRLRPFLSLRQTTMERIRSVGERMKELKSFIRKKAKFLFKDITTGANSKMEVVVSFLALLELVKQRTVHTSQSKTFSDINIDRV